MGAFPTYCRAGAVETWKHVPANVWGAVEPSQFAEYRKAYPRAFLRVLPRDGLSITYKRQWILERAKEDGARWLFMLEDDLTGFSKRTGGTTAGGNVELRRTTWKEVLTPMVDCAQRNNIALLGLSQRQSNFHYSATDEVHYAAKTTEFVLLDLEALARLGVSYDLSLNQFEDFDIAINLLTRGARVGLYLPAAFAHMEMGSNAGGHQTDAQRRIRECGLATEYLERKYPGYVTAKMGRVFQEPRVKWAELKKLVKP